MRLVLSLLSPIRADPAHVEAVATVQAAIPTQLSQAHPTKARPTIQAALRCQLPFEARLRRQLLLDAGPRTEATCIRGVGGQIRIEHSSTLLQMDPLQRLEPGQLKIRILSNDNLDWGCDNGLVLIRRPEDRVGSQADVCENQCRHDRDAGGEPVGIRGLIGQRLVRHVNAHVERHPGADHGQAAQPMVQVVPSLADGGAGLGADKTNNDL